MPFAGSVLLVEHVPGLRGVARRSVPYYDAAMIAIIVRFLSLWLSVSEWPDVRPEIVGRSVASAMLAETKHAPAELLLALAWGESRLEPDAAPACGVMQVYPSDLELAPSACAVWRSSVLEGYRAGVLELEVELADGRVRGDLRAALLYRACGNAAFRVGACSKHGWVDAALARYRALRARTAGV